ncbi:hypothetical protein [Shinella sp. NM-101]|uniref:hypothetical protein n=1 Tax=Shinella sp. NM-101 TaxID=2744455 RepID=UPI001F47F503|nr:hypothetical protein [Shinella sp. NM-101]
MTVSVPRRAFVSRPASPERWIKTSETPKPEAKADIFTARLTIDVTPGLRGRIKIAAFARGITMSDLLRDLLAREFPERAGGEP